MRKYTAIAIILPLSYVLAMVLAGAVTWYVTMRAMDERCNEYTNAELSAQAVDHIAKIEEASAENSWRLFYSLCRIGGGKVDTCLSVARKGYQNRIHELTPVPGWDWDFVKREEGESG